MKRVFDSSRWTGLVSNRMTGDVHLSQNPRPGPPEPLETIRIAPRLITPSAIFAVALILAFWVLAVLVEFQDATRLAMIILALLVLGNLASWFQQWRYSKGTLELDPSGLHLAGTLASPIPWSKIGRIEHHNTMVLPSLLVELDQDYETHQIYPWPISLIANESFRLKLPALYISTAALSADSGSVKREIERFRDNYCSA